MEAEKRAGNEEERQEVQGSEIELLTSGASVTTVGPYSLQVCAPDSWTNTKVERFAEILWPCGTVLGWTVRENGHRLLNGYSSRVPCAVKDGFVHVMLDA